ncbi:MAG TPA: chromosomal replication initiator protein DnaA, partial [Fimbriimonadaceae bacterium]|nr:chromosomal replication initiator protein DnaA [Fimbriimonadaceae bacterium]
MNDQYTLDDSDELIRLRQAWNHVTKRASGEIPSQSFERFIRPLKPLSLGVDSAQVAAPGKFVHEWVSARCLSMLESYLSDEIGRTVRIELTWEAREKPTTKTPAAVAAPMVETSHFRPNDRYTFDSFVVGQSNRMAHAGAKAVAAQPGARYNPLFICGPSGLGKTHLLHAIAREVMATAPKYQVAYITAQQFAEEFVGALQNNRVENFRRAQRNVGLWLIDDIQFIAGKDKTQEEVFHTFNHLYSLNKQIVICADRAPRELQLMDERLRSRFESGLVADIQMPDTETRCAIIQSKAAHDSLDLAHDVAFYLAENVPGNIRQLEGALTRLAVQASLEEKPLLMELAQAMVEKYYRGTLEKPDVMEIIAAVSSQFGISKEDIKGISR